MVLTANGIDIEEKQLVNTEIPKEEAATSAMSEEQETDITKQNSSEVSEVGSEESRSDEGGEHQENNSQQHFEQLEKEISSLKEEILRTRAEIENTRKRASKDVEAAHKYGAEKLFRDILPVVDSLELGVESSKEASEITSVIDGIEMTLKMFREFFARMSVEEISPLGQVFDPESHQAMSVEKSDTEAPGTIIKVFQKGYLLNGRLLRPALVVVAESVKQEDKT